MVILLVVLRGLTQEDHIQSLLWVHNETLSQKQKRMGRKRRKKKGERQRNMKTRKEPASNRLLARSGLPVYVDKIVLVG